MTKLKQSIAEQAKTALANHSIEKYCDIPGEGDANFGIWRCGKRDDQGRFSSYYYFRVIHTPGLLWVGGDVGNCEWRREYDMIAWARGSINDPSYFFGKVPQHIKREQFCSEKAIQFLNELKANADEDDPIHSGDGVYHDLVEAAENGDQHRWMELYTESGLYDGDIPHVYDYTPDLYWARECVKWFLERVITAKVERLLND